MEMVQDQNNIMRQEIEAYHHKYIALKKFALFKKISLPLELEMV